MITGEHAVIYGAPAVVAAIDQRATVHLTFRTTPSLHITSQIAPPFVASMEDLVAEGPYRFVIAAVLAYRARIAGGITIHIHSEINHTLGLGSSAAVTMATLAALEGAAPARLHDTGLRIIRAIQGRGSGADLAASLMGGALAYRISGDGPARIQPLPLPPQLSLFNVGYKTPTSEVLAKVAAARAANPEHINAVFDEMERISDATIAQIIQGDWAATGPNICAYQDLMSSLGVSDAALDAAIAQATGCDGVIGAKISGSGLGDCALAIGAVPEGFEPVRVAQEGVVFHDNA